MIGSTEIIEVKNAETVEKTEKAILNELKQDLADWLTADRDLVWRPAIELTKENNEFAARALVPGVEAKDIAVTVAPEVLMIKGATPNHRKILRSIRFPRPVNPGEVHAEMKDGILCVHAEMAGAAEDEFMMPKAA